MSDVNLYSYNGPDYDSVILHENEQAFGAPDNPYWSDTLKYTGKLKNFEHAVGTVYGGKEDCIDINNECDGVSIAVANGLYSGGQYVATIKGGSRNITLIGEIMKPGKTVDVDIGNWSDQSSKKTTDIKLNLWRRDGKPVRVRVLNGEKPAPSPNGVPYQYTFPHPDSFLHPVWVWLFLWTRRLKLWR